MESDAAPLPSITQAEFDAVLDDHEQWLAGGDPARGRRAKLRRTDLRTLALTGVNLEGADLREADLSGMKLEGANFSHATLTGTNLAGATLTEAKLQHARLSRADLSGAKGLTAVQLRGCDLCHTTLPEGLSFDTLPSANQASENLRPQLVSFLMICLYSWLTISSTTDIDLVTNAKSVAFPFIDVSLPIVGLYFVAPLLVFAFYLSCHLHLLIFWSRLASLPAVFPNGSALTEAVDSNLLDTSIEQQLPVLDAKPSLVSHLHKLVVRLGLDGLCLVTLVFYWVRYLPRHGWMGTTLHLGLLGGGLAVAAIFPRLMAREFARESGAEDRAKDRRSIAWAGLITASAIGLSALVFVGPKIPALVFAYANFGAAELSVEGEEGDEETGHGPNLSRTNLRFANLDCVVAASTTLNDTVLEGASLRQAQLQRARLQNARLAMASLEDAILDGADLSHAQLSEANLIGAKLNGTVFARAELREANLNGVDGEACDFSLAQLEGARLSMAKLPKAKLFLANASGSHLWKANLDDAHMILANFNGANLSGTSLRRSDLRQAKFEGADLEGVVLTGAHMIHTNFNGANLSKADLSFGDLSKGQLQSTDLRGAKLDGAKLDGAWLEGTRLEGVDLSGVEDLSAEQLGETCMSNTTRLPRGLDEQAIRAEAAEFRRLHSDECTEREQGG